MKKTFALKEPGKVDARVVEAVKNEVRKYVKRERHKKPPEGYDTWSIACRTGAEASTASSCEVDDLNRRIDAAVATGATVLYVEILASPANRPSSAPAQD